MSDKMREEFEAWVATVPVRFGVPVASLFYKDEAGYVDGYVDSAWFAWQASRAALVFEFPNVADFPDYEGGYDIGQLYEAIQKQLEAAGVKVES